MSTPSSGAPRRRRIAGERRAVRLTGGTSVVDVPPDAPVVDAPPDAPVVDVPADDTRRPPARAVPALTATLAVLVTLGVLAALGLLGTPGVGGLAAADEVERATSSAPAAAERAAGAILVYDHETLEADQRSASAFMTDGFAEQYSETFEKVVAPAAEQTRAEVTAEVRASGVVRASSERAKVLLFVDQTTVSSANEAPQQALNRVEMIMVREGDRWLVDDITSY